MGQSGSLRDLRGGTGNRSRHAGRSKSDSAPSGPATGASQKAMASYAPSPTNEIPPPLKPQPVSPRISPQYPVSPVGHLMLRTGLTAHRAISINGSVDCVRGLGEAKIRAICSRGKYLEKQWKVPLPS